MSIPKSKMLSASRAIMAIANRTRETREISNKTVQSQTVNITLPRNQETTIQQPPIVSYPPIPDIHPIPDPGIADPSATYRCPMFPSVAPVAERSVSIEPETPVQNSTNNASYNDELYTLYNMLNNYETVLTH